MKASDNQHAGWAVLIGIALIVGCVLAAVLVANLVDLIRPGTFARGRDFRPTATMAATFIAVAAIWWSRNSVLSGRGLLPLLVPLIVIELLVVVLILAFSGNFVIDKFFLDWFFGINLFLGLPWLVGIGVGRVI